VLRESETVCQEAGVFQVDLSGLAMKNTEHEFPDKYKKYAIKEVAPPK
jgi:hypothetical protein